MASWVRGKCIGKGAFGTVSVGVSKSDGRVFAVKSVDLKTGLPAQVEALENEIRILRKVEATPYVVGLLGDDVTTSHRNLHLEYLPGGTLADLASRNADVDERLVRYYTWCLVSALTHVHSRGVVHCDVKGRNVLLGPNGSVAKLADFGSAVEVSGEGEGEGHAAAAMILPRGSPLWMAPEVIRRESQGPESDVWSLGCTVIEMVTGKPAWEDHGGDSLSRIAYSGDVPEFPVKLSELGRDFLEKCLRREPKQRWSCDQLLQHPFLCSAPPNKLVEKSSPRCVLDWENSEFDEEEEMRLDAESEAKDRIGKLAATLRANWETEGWMSVRGVESDTEATATETGDCGSEEGEGTSWEYGDWEGVERGITKVETSWGFGGEMRKVKNEGGKWERGGIGKRLLVWRCDHRESIAGWSCQYGSKIVELVGIISISSFCCNLFISHYFNLLSINLHLLLFFWIISAPYLFSILINMHQECVVLFRSLLCFPYFPCFFF